MSKSQSYKMSFSTGGLFLNESLEIARLYAENSDWNETIQRAKAEGMTSLPKVASNQRTVREITNRLRMLSEEECGFLVETADRADQQALLWLATCRAYRFIREFALEVIRERYLSYQLDLPRESFDQLFEAKAEWDDGLSEIKPSTRSKLQQIAFRIMREAGIISDVNRIQTAILSTRLKTMIEDQNPAELALFPGIPVNGV
ncbi:DUF1819 family protein [Donghicola tyrosinivorans]|uniref:Putative inner membrane protein DUF1819 n=1 Tax=Donghicola tyrosinivorans TaxID=1652492 RepID=A0A2T0X5R6_9RHOB|nr:DUF1819 family protein [Donghicola tyrosinivorans]PRY94288.1 putative inner membrane protein DUF1819 [Donghicola tyrosinivorans]